MKYLFLITLLLPALWAGAQQPCNYPLPLADSCAKAPFLCGNFLDGYCSTTDSLTDDTIGQWTFHGGGFLRLSPCADSLLLRVELSDCTDSSGLRLRLFLGDCGAISWLSEYQVPADTAVELWFANLLPDTVYYLAFDSPDGAICGFKINVLQGIGTATLTDSCSCTDGTIDGPAELCPGQVATYTIIPPVCTALPTPVPVGGNGIFCPPPPGLNACGQADSLVLVWHIPDALMFVGDSTGTSIQVTIDTALLYKDTLNPTLPWVDTLILGSIWVEWKAVNLVPADSLVFCGCGSVCTGAILPKQVIIKYVIRHEFCQLSCFGAPCIVDNVPYFAPGVYLQQPDSCTAVIVTIAPGPPPILVNAGADQQVCAGTPVQLQAQPVLPGLLYQWSTGATGPAVSVQPTATTTYTVTATDIVFGCTTSDEVTVTVVPRDTISLGQVATISCTQPCVEVFGESYCQAGTYTRDSACTRTVFEIDFEKAVQNLGVVDTITCTEPCAVVLGQTYCDPGDYTWEDSCTIYHFSIATDTLPPQVSAPVFDCLPSNTQYTVAFFIQGQAPFKVNGDTIAGASYLSAPMSNGSTYLFVVKQVSNGCEASLGGEYDCSLACGSDAGAMSATPLSGCTDQPLQAQAAIQATYAAGDTVVFVLHTAPGTVLGTVLASNGNGVFTFDSTTMVAGQQYFISQVAGPKGPGGGVDLGNPCTKVAPGQPVTFRRLWLDLGPDQAVLLGESVNLAAKTNAASAASITWTANDAVVQSGTVEWQAVPLGNTRYFCTIVDDNGCSATDDVGVSVGNSKVYYPNVVLMDASNPMNRYFTLYAPGVYVRSIRSLEIYNRWGGLVFSKQNFPPSQSEEGWDGTARGKTAPTDVYSFVARVELYNGEEQVFVGDVTLIQ